MPAASVSLRVGQVSHGLGGGEERLVVQRSRRGISAVGASFITMTCFTVLRSLRMGSSSGQRLASTMRTWSSAWLMM